MHNYSGGPDTYFSMNHKNNYDKLVDLYKDLGKKFTEILSEYDPSNYINNYNSRYFSLFGEIRIYTKDDYLSDIFNYIINNKKITYENVDFHKYEDLIKFIENKKNELDIIKSKKTPSKKKKYIPVALKRNVWNRYVGESIGKTLCECCKLTEITQMNFSCGHVISEFNGGPLNIDNLKPICGSCNSSMSTKNMDEFIRNYGLGQKLIDPDTIMEDV